MATVSANSSIQKSFKYDVFISFRGEDTRKSFVDHLYHALQRKNIITYRDDEEIKKGERIRDEIMRSIEDSKSYIIVFSKNYASSSWCLDELVKIMECHRTKEHTAYPVFYDLEPTEVRKLSGAVGETFAKHKEEKAVEKWRDALKEAADLAGWELKNTFDGHEAKFIQHIVEKISQELGFNNLGIDEKLVGMERRVNVVVPTLETDIDDVRMIGIKGIGGGGKTTLARSVFDQISIMFDGSSFVENAREISKGSLGGLKSLQTQVLSDVLETQDIDVHGVSDGKKLIRKMMCSRKVLIVLDDVDHIDQLEALAGEPSWFKPGSRVIITTRDEQVLVAHGVQKNLILDVSLLSPEEAHSLFNKYTFGKGIPNQGYEMLSSQVVSYAAGLPLTIRVLGSFLRGKGEYEWTDALERLKTIPLKETLEILELSYDSLEQDYKEMFLDVACILKGWKKAKSIRVLESCGFHARSGLKVLEQKSLITISRNGCLSMHDHIEEMGKNIVRRLYPDDPSTHSRLWIEEEIEDILVENKGTKETRCMKVRLANPTTVMKGLRNMKKLRFLYVISIIKDGHDLNCDGYDSDTAYYNRHYHDSYLDDDDIGEDSQYLPHSVQYLCWIGYPYTCLSKYSQANNLVGLEMYLSNITQLWEGEERKVLKKLRFIDLSFCKLRTLDIGLLPHLERLNLVACDNLVELHTPVENFKLKYLQICRSKLRTLDLVRAQDLETLKVTRCMDLIELHFPIESLKLKHLSLQWSKLRILNLKQYQNLERLYLVCWNLVELRLPDVNFKLKSLSICSSKLRIIYIRRAHHLENVEIKKSYDLEELHLPVEKLKSLLIECCGVETLNLTHTQSLEKLHLINCQDLLELHMPIENPKLKTIYVHRSKLRSLKLTQSQSLEKLDLMECDTMLKLHMPIKRSELKTIYLRCSKLRTLNLTLARNLKNIHLKECEDLLVVDMPIKSPELKAIYMSCSKLKTLSLTRTQSLETLHLIGCEDLRELHLPIKSYVLRIIHMSCSKLKTLDLRRTQNLESLHLVQCYELLELHMPIECHELKIIHIRSLKLRSLNITGIRNLETLDLVQCEDLQELHMPKKSPKLKAINICGSKLRSLYLGTSPCLECLDLHDCFTLEEVSAPVGCLSGRVRFIPFCVNQNFPIVNSLAELHLTARSLGICPLHPDNNLPKFHFECTYRELLPVSTRNLEKLISFGLCSCTSLASISQTISGLQCLRKLTLKYGIPEVLKEIGQLECLEELTLLSTKIEHLPNSICTLKHLKVLQLKSCRFLKKLPEDIGRLECLEELHLTDCTYLRDIPNSICEMKRLKCFHLRNCKLVKKLPKEMGRLTCLKELNIEGTSIIYFPESIFRLEDLRLFI